MPNSVSCWTLDESPDSALLGEGPLVRDAQGAGVAVVLREHARLVRDAPLLLDVLESAVTVGLTARELRFARDLVLALRARSSEP